MSSNVQNIASPDTLTNDKFAEYRNRVTCTHAMRLLAGLRYFTQFAGKRNNSKRAEYSIASRLQRTTRYLGAAVQIDHLRPRGSPLAE